MEAAVAELGGADNLYNTCRLDNLRPLRGTSPPPVVLHHEEHLELVFLATRFVWKHLVARGGGSISLPPPVRVSPPPQPPTVAH